MANWYGFKAEILLRAGRTGDIYVAPRIHAVAAELATQLGAPLRAARHAEHAARMTALGFLPNAGLTAKGRPFNLTDKVGRMLNELEHAHLFVAALDRENSTLRGDLEQKRARLALVEARLGD